MENFSVDEVSDLLREHKMPEQLIETLADNHIDGVALFALPEDFEEFKCVVPQSGLRLRLKTLLRNLRASFSPFTPHTSLGSTAELVSSSMAVINPPLHDVPMDYGDSEQILHFDEEILTVKKQKVDIEAGIEKEPYKIQAAKQLRLPDPCPLPNNFSLITTKAIENNSLKGNVKLRLTREAASFYYGICPKPTSTEYINMAKTLCDKYPQLKDKGPDKDYWETVKSYLSQRYRNSRRPSDPVPVESKKKIVAVSHATALPDTGPSEDTDLVAYERNTKKMTSMFKSQSFNHQHFHRLMKLTYQLRRLNINSSSMTVSANKEEYPYFGNAKWVQAEFKLMFGDDIPEKMLTNWNNILPALLRFGDVEVPEIFIEQTMYKAMEIIDKAFHSSGVTAKSDPAFVIYELGTNVQSVLKEKSFAEPKLVIFTNRTDSGCKAQGFVLAEQNIMFEIPDFTVVNGLISLLAAYYTYDISYPKAFAASNFLLFLQECILENRNRKVKHAVRYNDFVNTVMQD